MSDFKKVVLHQCKWCGKLFKTDRIHKCKFRPECKNCFSCAHSKGLDWDYCDDTKILITACGKECESYTLAELAQMNWMLSCPFHETHRNYQGSRTWAKIRRANEEEENIRKVEEQIKDPKNRVPIVLLNQQIEQSRAYLLKLMDEWKKG